MRTRDLIHGFAAAMLLATLPLTANAALFVSVSFGPPLLPVYVPPPMPAPGYIWVPGYWAWNGDDYYWVPGTWVLPPEVGFLWTPGYWGWSDGAYLWHAGYWGPQVGFYGGINYGCGYDGSGYHGGYWQGNTFVVNNTVINQVSVNRVAFNGGAGGVVASATSEQLRAAHAHHLGMSEAQLRQQHVAAADNSLRASVNHGRPPVAATSRAGVLHGQGIVAARSGGASYSPPARSSHEPGPPAHTLHSAHAQAPAHPHTSEVAHEQESHHPAKHEPSTHVQSDHASAHARAPAHEPTPRAVTHEHEPIHLASAHEQASPAHERASLHEQAEHPATQANHEKAPRHEQSPRAAVHEPAAHPATGTHGGAPGSARPPSHAEQGQGNRRPERPAEHNHTGSG
jgi:hypothetical protein